MSIIRVAYYRGYLLKGRILFGMPIKGVSIKGMSILGDVYYRVFLFRDVYNFECFYKRVSF